MIVTAIGGANSNALRLAEILRANTSPLGENKKPRRLEVVIFDDQCQPQSTTEVHPGQKLVVETTIRLHDLSLPSAVRQEAMGCLR